VKTNVTESEKPKAPLRRRAPRGAVSVEFALGVPVVMSLFIGGFVLVYATFTKERLTTATIQAARVCALRPANENPAACVRNVGIGLMAADAGRCDGGVQFDAQQNGDPRNTAQISMLRVTGRCNYRSPVWPNRLPQMNFQSEAQMPRMPMVGP
jgi:hypothetical protein